MQRRLAISRTCLERLTTTCIMQKLMIIACTYVKSRSICGQPRTLNKLVYIYILSTALVFLQYKICLFPALALLLATRLTTSCRQKPGSRLLVLVHDILHAATIVLWFPHICQSGSPCPLLLPLHHLYTLNIWAINLVPHLHTDSRQLIP